METEAALQARWAARPPRWITTTTGDRLRVIFAGSWNRGPGPDFRGAILAPEGGRALLAGDVEVHRQEQDWWRHGHDRDPAYDGVVLHLLGGAGGGPPRAGGGDGARPLSAAVARLPLPELREAAGGAADGADASAPDWAPPCTDVVQRAGVRVVEARLFRIARTRFQSKTARARVQLRQGAQRGPLSAAAAYLLGGSGPGGSGSRRGRPANHPARRLAAAATLAGRLQRAGGVAAGLAALAALPEGRALQRLRVPGLLGVERARQLLVDVAYPLAAARSGGEPGLAARWLALGGARYGRTEALRQRLSRGGLRSWRNGETQALLDLERFYCRNGACAVCPLAALAPSRRRGPIGSPNLPLPPSEDAAAAAH